MNVTGPGFLSTQEKVKDFSSSEVNLENLEVYIGINQSMDELDSKIQKAKTCAESQGTADTSPSTSSGYLAKTGSILLFGAVSALSLVL